MQIDLGAPAQLENMLRAGAIAALRSWGGQGPVRVLPQALELATRADGTPDCQFDMIRRDDASVAPYALLSLRVQATPTAPADLDALCAAAPQSILQPATFEGGFLRVLPVGTDLTLPPALAAAQPLAWNELGRANLRIRLDGDAARLAEALFRHAAIPLLLHAELEYTGMVAGVGLQVEFDPARLVAALRDDASGLVRRSALLERLGAGLASLPLTWQGELAHVDRAAVADALLARLRGTLAQFAAAPTAGPDDFLYLPGSPSGRMTWDLSAPCLGRRGLCLTQGAFAALAQLGNPDAWLHRITPRSPGFGGWRVAIAADLPGALQDDVEDGTVRFGVALHAPATAARGAIDTDIIELPAPGRQAATTLRLGAGETPAFETTTYCRWPGGVWQAGTARLPSPANPARLTLAADDFPARSIRLGLTGRLAALTTLRCEASGCARGAPFRASVTLDAARPQATLCCPRDADTQQLTVDALAIGAAGTAHPPVRLVLPLQSIELDLPLFPGYGPQGVDVDCRFADGETGPLLLEMADGALGNIFPLRLTSMAPTAHFEWWSAQPFLPQYCWRRHGAAAWSAPQPAAQPLHLTLQGGVAFVLPPTPRILP